MYRSPNIRILLGKLPRVFDMWLPCKWSALRVEQLEDRLQPSGTLQIVGSALIIASNTFLVSEDNNVVLENSLTGAAIATYATGVANDGAVTATDGSFYVADYFNDQILHYSPTSNYLSSFPTLGTPQGLSFGPDGNLYVTTTSSTVEKYNPTGTFLGTFIAAGSGGLNNAKYIVWGPDGNAYVSSFYNSEVIRYNGTTGAFMNVFATGGGGGFEQIAFGPDGNLYAADYGYGSILCFNGSTGVPLGTFVSGVSTAYGLQFDPAGNLQVSSRSTGDIETFNPTGQFLGNFATGLTNPGYINSTASLITSEAGMAANFSAELNSQPTANAIVNLTSTDPSEGALSSSTLIFTPNDWNVPQTVTVTGLDNHISGGAQSYQIDGTASSNDLNYSGISMSPITVINEDTDALTTTSINSTADPSTYGQGVTFTATVTASDGGIPIGSVVFMDGTTNLATVSLSGGTATFTTTALTAGTHQIAAEYVAGPLYVSSSSPVLAQTVDPALLTVTATDSSKVYGQAIPTFSGTIAGFVNGDTANAVAGAADLVTTASSTSGVGSYTIAASLGTLQAANYTFSFVNGTLAVTPAVLTVSANDTSKVYGQPNPAFTYSVSGFVNGDSLTVIGGSPDLATSATASNDVGSYAITVGLGTLSAANYSFVPVDGLLTVTPAILTVTANDASKVYGHANPTLGDTISGFVNGDSSTVVSGGSALATSTSSLSGVGSYTITAGPGTLSAENYVFTFVNGTLSITPATLTVTANNANKIEGQSNPDFTDTIGGFVNGDSSSVLSGKAAIHTSATAASAVGMYPITATPGSLSAVNYTFAFVDGILTVSSKKPVLTVTVNNVTTVLGKSISELTYTMTGFVNGDTAQVVSGTPALSTPATSAGTAGTFIITAGPGSLSAANYTFNFINGTFTVIMPIPTPSKSETASSGPTDLLLNLSTQSVTNSNFIGTTSFQTGSGPNSVTAMSMVVSGGTSNESGVRDKSLPPIHTPATNDLRSIVALDTDQAALHAPSFLVDPTVPYRDLKPADGVPTIEATNARSIPITAGSISQNPRYSDPQQGFGILGEDDEFADRFFAQLDRPLKDLRSTSEEEAITNSLVVAGGVVAAGSVLLNTRAVYWFLSALLARPAVWRRFDPLDVIYAWERERLADANHHQKKLGKNESLQALVN